MLKIFLAALILFSSAACTFGFEPVPLDNGTTSGETGSVVNVIDGDTIDVMLDGQRVRVRYIGMNTPERDESCYAEATAANAALVESKTVTLVKDQSETDSFDRLLRYIYVGDIFVNAQLVTQGYAEAVLYEPDDAHYNEFLNLERQATNANLGCHPTGIFNDGSDTR
jgi:endonuclease YncB( thermonuclease family)